jgi:flagellar basal-body rod protein FlgB
MEVSQARTLVKEAINNRAIRQDLIASNIANVDTPFYRPKDIRFEDVLARKANDIFNGKSEITLKMAQTHQSHVTELPDELNPYKSTIFFRDGHQARNDGNSVDLDVETTEMTKNSTMYNALIGAYNKSGKIFKDMIAASARTQ